ncbi:MAG: hypothetical protein PUP91_21070 [Rhizonema sp. PD37]|nr:hypothetical protein [Rhizonema sp. PD37]
MPISVAASYFFQHQHEKSGENVAHKPQIPWFIGLFLLASVARTFLSQLETWSPVVTPISEAGLTLTLFLIGALFISANAESCWLETDASRGNAVDNFKCYFPQCHSTSGALEI